MYTPAHFVSTDLNWLDWPAEQFPFGTLISQIAFAGKAMAREVARAPLSGRLGLSGDENPSGEDQKKLDLITNEMMIQAVADTGTVAAIVSEEMEEPRSIPKAETGFILCVDPLDGSSNTDINGGVGTIFGIYRRRPGASGRVSIDELLRPGSEQVAAGFINYGPSTMAVLTTGKGVSGFTLDSDLGEFMLTHPSLSCPRRGKYYSANLGNLPKWSPGIREFVDYLMPQEVNIRRVFFDDARNEFWIGANHSAELLKVEPLD